MVETKIKASNTVTMDNEDIPKILSQHGYQMVAAFGVKHIEGENYDSLLICQGDATFLEMIRDVAIQQLKRLQQ